MSKFILVDEYTDVAGELKGKPKYFREMVAIGPRSTPHIEDAWVFHSEDEARRSPANRHWSSNWTVQELPEPAEQEEEQ